MPNTVKPPSTPEEKLKIAVNTLRSISKAMENDQGWWTQQAKDALKRIGEKP